MLSLNIFNYYVTYNIIKYRETGGRMDKTFERFFSLHVLMHDIFITCVVGSIIINKK